MEKIIGIGIVAVLVLVIGFQRVYFTCHWFSDVIGGFFSGTSCLLYVIAVLHGHINNKILIGLGSAFGMASVVVSEISRQCVYALGLSLRFGKNRSDRLRSGCHSSEPAQAWPRSSGADDLRWPRDRTIF